MLSGNAPLAGKTVTEHRINETKTDYYYPHIARSCFCIELGPDLQAL